MKAGHVIAFVGGLVAVVFAFANLGQYLYGGRDYVALTILLLLAALMGALPGIIIGWLGQPRRPP
jgi:ABC-type xylose transport system permease subunit